MTVPAVGAVLYAVLRKLLDAACLPAVRISRPRLSREADIEALRAQIALLDGESHSLQLALSSARESIWR